MMGITELAPAKLNLTLDVGARRPDGYHDITSIMQSAALKKKSPPRPVLAAAAATQPPCCGECVVYFMRMCPTNR